MYISIFSYSLRYNISIFSLVNLNTIFTDNQKFNIEMKQVSSKPTTFEKEINSDNVEYTNNSSENEIIIYTFFCFIVILLKKYFKSNITFIINIKHMDI